MLGGWRRGRGIGETSRPSCSYTGAVLSFATRLTCLAMAVVLSGSPAVMATCMAWCLAGPMADTSHAHGEPTHHNGHAAVPEPAAATPHAHHTSAPSGHPVGVPDARLVGNCSSCCGAGLVELVAGPGVEKTDAKALGAAPTVDVALRRVTLSTRLVAALHPQVPPRSPVRAPLVLRI